MLFRLFLTLATVVLLFVALRYGVVGIAGLANYRRENPAIFWLGVGGLVVMLAGETLSLMGLF